MMAKRIRLSSSSSPNVVPQWVQPLPSYPAIWKWTLWGPPCWPIPYWYIGHAHFDQRVRQYWEILNPSATAFIGIARFDDSGYVDHMFVEGCGWDSENQQCHFQPGVQKLGLLWDPKHGRTVSLFANGVFVTEFWKDIPPELHPIFSPGICDRCRLASGVRMQDILTLQNACFKPLVDLDTAVPIELLPNYFRDEIEKRKRHDYIDLYKP